MVGYGGLEKILIKDIETPNVHPGEIRIRVQAASINPLDWKLLSGHLRFICYRQDRSSNLVR